MAGVGMDNDDASECSEELGMDYDRIEYPKEAYDLVHGRPTKEQPIAKKQKVEDCLSISQSSQASMQFSQASSSNDVEASNGRQRNQKQTAHSEKTADGARKSVKSRRAKKDVKMVKDDDEIISDERDRKSSQSAKTEKKATQTVQRELKLRGRNVTVKVEEAIDSSPENNNEDKSVNPVRVQKTEEKSRSTNGKGKDDRTKKDTRPTRKAKVKKTAPPIVNPSDAIDDAKLENVKKEDETIEIKGQITKDASKIESIPTEVQDEVMRVITGVEIDSSPEKRNEDKSAEKDNVRVEKTEEKVEEAMKGMEDDYDPFEGETREIEWNDGTKMIVMTDGVELRESSNYVITDNGRRSKSVTGLLADTVEIEEEVDVVGGYDEEEGGIVPTTSSTPVLDKLLRSLPSLDDMFPMVLLKAIEKEDTIEMKEDVDVVGGYDEEEGGIIPTTSSTPVLDKLLRSPAVIRNDDNIIVNQPLPTSRTPVLDKLLRFPAVNIYDDDENAIVNQPLPSLEELFPMEPQKIVEKPAPASRPVTATRSRIIMEYNKPPQPNYNVVVGPIGSERGAVAVNRYFCNIAQIQPLSHLRGNKPGFLSLAFHNPYVEMEIIGQGFVTLGTYRVHVAYPTVVTIFFDGGQLTNMDVEDFVVNEFISACALRILPSNGNNERIALVKAVIAKEVIVKLGNPIRKWKNSSIRMDVSSHVSWPHE